jgi:GNAT superfamily N-acetyltransferase
MRRRIDDGQLAKGLFCFSLGQNPPLPAISHVYTQSRHASYRLCRYNLFAFTMSSDFRVRPAFLADLPVLRALIDASVRRLQADDYTLAQREAALATVFGVDTQLISDGTYLVVEFHPAGSQSEPVIIACGGWSKRKTLYGADQWTNRQDDLLDPHQDAAKIRAFFIHPDWARRGVGTLLLEACENAARCAGFRRFELGATLTGAKLFRARGYLPVRDLVVPLSNGESLPIIHMEKQA